MKVGVEPKYRSKLDGDRSYMPHKNFCVMLIGRRKVIKRRKVIVTCNWEKRMAQVKKGGH